MKRRSTERGHLRLVGERGVAANGTRDLTLSMIDLLFSSCEVISRRGSLHLVVECLEAGEAMVLYVKGERSLAEMRELHTALYRLTQRVADREWLKAALPEPLDRECANALVWMAFRTAGFIIGRPSGTNAYTWVRMFHASIFARFDEPSDWCARGGQ